MTLVLVVDNTRAKMLRRPEAALPLHAVLAAPLPAAAQALAQEMRRDVGRRIERRDRRRRWLRAAYRTGRALGALTVLAVVCMAGVGFLHLVAIGARALGLLP